jgi:DNA-binding protein HU-alpha
MIVTETSPVVSAPEMKKVELVDAVVERSGIKKKDAKPAIEAALAILGEALADGRDLNLRPLGKVKVQRTKEMANGSVLTVRIRQASPKVEDDTSPSPIADAAE